MSSIIRATTTSGLQIAPDNSGSLQLQTNGTTTAVTIDTSQNVGIGTSSPITKLNISGSSLPSGELGTLVVTGNTTAKRLTIGVDSSSTMYSWMQSVESGVGFYGLALQPLGGNVGIGTTSPAAKLEATVSNGTHRLGVNSSDTNYNVRANGGSNCSITWTENGQADRWTVGCVTGQGYLGFRYNTANMSGGTEAMRIDSSGNVLVGTTSSIGGKISSVNAGDAVAAQVLSNNNFSTFIGKNLSGTATFYVAGTGQITAAFTSIASTSDQRLKENITNLDLGLDAIMALKPRKFDWKAGKGKNIKGDRGFIAQEFEQVFPDLVSISKYDAPKDEEPYKTISVDLMPVLVKAIQEQQTIINDLKARIETLEAK